jgi:iron complex transport system ATP-binding protein
MRTAEIEKKNIGAVKVKGGDSGSILSIYNLSFAYDGHEVLKDISFEVENGDFISILGPNGSGKSTLINLISKALKNYKGKIKIKNTDIEKTGIREIAKLVAVVPQNITSGFDFTVGEIVMMGRFPYISRFGREKKEDFEIVQNVMDKTKILDLANKKFNELSGGERQRVVIAQALVQDAPIMLLDEPTSHLDINFQIEFMDLFLKLNLQEEKTIIGVFHDINLAINYSKKILFLRNGSIYSYGDINSTVTKEAIKTVFNSEVYIGKNPITGKLYISPTFKAGLEKNENAKNIKIHVIGGGGAASPVLNLLYRKGYSLSCGVVNNFDTDLDTAKMLEISYISEAPFSPISFESQNKNFEFIKASDVVILPEIEFGHGNFSNIVSVKEALDLGKKVIILDSKNVTKRDHTDGKAVRLYNKILEKGAIRIEGINDILRILEEK